MKLPKLNGDYLGFSLISTGNVVANVVGGVMWLLLASLMQVDEYGEISYYIALATVIGSAVPLGLETVLLTYLPKEKDRRLFTQSTTLTLLVSAVAATAVAFVSWQAAIMLLSVAYFALNTGEILGSQRYKEYAVVVIIERIARLGLSLALFYFIGPFGILLGFAISHFALSIRFFQATKNVALKFDLLRPKFRFAGYSLGWTMLQLMPTVLDKSIITLFFGFNTLGLYQIAMQFVAMAGILPTSIYQYMLPKRSEGVISNSLIMIAIAVAVVITLLFIFVSPVVIETFFPQFSSAELLVQITGFAVIPITVTAMMNSILQAKERARTAFIGGIIYLSVLIVGLVVIGNAVGMVGLGIAFVVAQISQMIFTVVSVRMDGNK